MLLKIKIIWDGKIFVIVQNIQNGDSIEQHEFGEFMIQQHPTSRIENVVLSVYMSTIAYMLPVSNRESNRGPLPAQLFSFDKHEIAECMANIQTRGNFICKGKVATDNVLLV